MRCKLLTGETVSVDAAAVDAFRASFRGDVLAAGSSGYDDARRIFNAAIDRRPALVARCKSVADVVAAVQFARDHKLLVSVRGGGADVAGTAIADGGVVVDLSRMTAVHVSPGKKTVRVEAGATWSTVDRETALYGLGAVGGSVAKVGVAGFTLGGGIGWLSRSHGLACDNLLSVDVVTADGKLVTASAGEHADLFWALKGGGGNFGVVTSFEFQLHDVQPMLGGLAVFPLPQAREVLETYRALTRNAPDALALYCSLLMHPEAGPVIAIAGCYVGNAVEGQEALRAVRALRPVMDAFRPMTYLDMQGLLDGGAPAGLYHSWKSSFLPALSDKAIATLVEQFGHAPPGPGCQILIEHMGGAIERVGRDETAFAHRDARYTALIMGAAVDAAGHKAAARWARTCWEALRPVASEAVYVNYLSHDSDDAARVPHAYDASTLTRLATVKAKYDAKNLFRHNHNIKPRDATTDSSSSSTTPTVAAGASSAELVALKKSFDALLSRFEALEDRVLELEFEKSVVDPGPKKKAPPSSSGAP